MIKDFTAAELEAMAENPDILKALADWHETQLTMGESMGFGCMYHQDRKKELLEEAENIENDY